MKMFDWAVHLDPDFTPNVETSEGYLDIDTMTFYGGEEKVRFRNFTRARFLENEGYPDSVMITSRLNSSQRVMQLLMAIDAVRQAGGVPSIFIPYFPYARQDRVCNAGESFSAKVMTTLINDAFVDHVYIYDPHSDIVPSLLDNVRVIRNYSFIQSVVRNMLELKDILPVDKIALVVPDEGAHKKMAALARNIHWTGNVVECQKLRKMSTGEIIDQRVINPEAADGKYCLIVDDIIDGGRTFLGLADKLTEAGSKGNFLACSHGIFSHGFKELTSKFTRIYTTESFKTHDLTGLTDKVHVYPIALEE